ncbi:MAG TPA: hypothetical protein PK544_04725 [Spirochaetota bacterium]|nr:hypothetical protein [Spirochaetota bacterium]
MNRKKIFTPVIITACILLMKPVVFSHDERPENYNEIFRTAKAVAVAKITNIESNESRCESRKVYTFKITQLLRGRIDSEPAYNLYYTTYYWKEATWPWQEDCPSVHYNVPPVAGNMEQGKSYIITIHRSDRNSEFYVSSSKDISELQRIMDKIRTGR